MKVIEELSEQSQRGEHPSEDQTAVTKELTL